MSDKRLGKLIAQGRTADIHAWQDDQTVVKLYHDWFQVDPIRSELYRAQQVQELDFPIPKVGEMVEVNGRHGLTYQRISGQNMLTALQQDPALISTLAPLLADLHHRLHSLPAQPVIRSQHQKLAANIRNAAPLSDTLKAALLAKLEQLPVGNAVCHGDFHPGNIMITDTGEAVVVDWIDCSLGNPIADVARSSILFLGGITGNELPDPVFEQLLLDFHDQYVAHYFQQRPVDKIEYEAWLPIIAGARLSENIAALEPWLLSQAEKIIT